MTDETGHQILAALEAIKIQQANAKTERAAIRGELDSYSSRAGAGSLEGEPACTGQFSAVARAL
jgi:hypothetical protein